jgi:ketosteroid isomerase-like protein
VRVSFIWKLRDGRVSSYEQFHDPALANAFR